jgi:hypothetical protein
MLGWCTPFTHTAHHAADGEPQRVQDGNAVASLEGIQALKELVTLSVRGNKLEKLDGITAANIALTTVNLDTNEIDSIEEAKKLTVLRNITSLTLSDNPKVEDYRMDMLVALPALLKLDGEVFENEEKSEAGW